MAEFKYRWVAVSIRDESNLPHVDRMKADSWQPVPPDDPMCPQRNDDEHRSLVLYRKPIELANAAVAEMQAHAASQLNDELERWRGNAAPHVQTFAEVTQNPKYKGAVATRDEILARLEDFYRPEHFANMKASSEPYIVDQWVEVNRLRRLINLPEWTQLGLRRQLLKHWKSHGGAFSKAPYYWVSGELAYAHDKRIEWGMPATFGEWCTVMLRKFGRP